jgi:NADPH-dependent 2,4-dienoyl-CoA reductase/sulfur reductase-like enzyme/pSer/pThr/pTyr-binding forkhead associated (FHA) protein
MPGQVSYLIIGNGIAGVTAAEILRNEDSEADITVIADDPFPVYYRPALKDYLAGRVREDKLWARPNSFYQDHRIRFLSDRVEGIQAGQHTIHLHSGQNVAYDRLLLANGARASQLACPGINLVGVTTLRTVADYQNVMNRLGTIRSVVVSGSGTLALETIETLRHRGYHVTHLLRHRILWSEVLDATASDLVLQQERRDGVDVRLEEEIVEITGKNGEVSGVITSNGARISCELVIIAIGIEPITDFIKNSAIPCGRGVRVDSTMRTNAPDIYAAGDILETIDRMTGRIRVIGQWYPAIQQARAAAYSMLDLLDTSYPFHSSTFYNATFLYGLDFASSGLTQPPREETKYQEIIADPLPRTYRKVILKDSVPVGMLSLGNRKETLAFKRAIDHRVDLSQVVTQLFTKDFKLNDWLDRQGIPPCVLSVSRKGAVAVQQATYARGITVGAPVMKPQPPVEAFLVPVVDMAQAQQQGMSLQRSIEETSLSQTKVMTIGRQAGSYLLIDQDSISRRHAEISYANMQYVLRDVGSSNGTFINEVRLEEGRAYILKPQDHVRFGKAKYVFQVLGANFADGTKTRSRNETKQGMTQFHELATGFYDPIAAGQVLSPAGQPILNVDGSMMLPGATKALPADSVAALKEAPALIVIAEGIPRVVHLIQGKRITLGRGTTCDVVLVDVAASRKHAEVFPSPDGFYIRDLGSANGVIINHMKVDNPYLLAHEDRITIGSIVIYFIDVRQEDHVDVIADASQNVPVQERKEQSYIEGAGLSPALNAPCRNCGTLNPSRARFCATCGTPLETSNAVYKS